MRKKSFSTKLFITAVIFIVAIVSSMTASYLYYQSERHSITEQAREYEIRILKDLQNDFEQLQSQLDKIQYEVTSQFVSLGMGKLDANNLQAGEVEKIHLLETQLQSIRRTSTGINNIYVINKNNEKEAVYGSTYKFYKRWLLEEEFLKVDYTSSREWSIIPDHPVSYLTSKVEKKYKQNCFSFIIGLANLDGDEKFEYLLQIDINSEYLYSIIRNIKLNEIDTVIVFDKDKNIVEMFGTEGDVDSFLLEKTKNVQELTKKVEVRREKDVMVSGTYIPELQVYICKISHPFMESAEKQLYRQVILLVLISLVVAVIAATKVASSFMRPFEQIIQATMHAIEDASGPQSVSIGSRSSYIQQMEEHFNILINRINQLIKDILRKETEKRNLEMRMLQAQINPHFLYNTLNSIKWMSLMKKEPEIAQAITSLVTLLEYCCKDTSALVPLKDEVIFLKDYIRIQKLRDVDKNIEVDFNISDETESLKIVKLSLQPSVENAFVHAFTEKKEDAKICVRSYIKEQRLILEIQDNGVGFNAKLVQKNMTGIGSKNVDDRIKLTFGEEFGQSIESEIGAGTRVTIEMPVIEE